MTCSATLQTTPNTTLSLSWITKQFPLMELLKLTPTPRVYMPIPVVAQSKAFVCEHSLPGISGLSLVSVVYCPATGRSIVQRIPTECVRMCVSLLVCVVECDQMQLKPLHLQWVGIKGQNRKKKKGKQAEIWLYPRVEREECWLIIEYSKMVSCFQVPRNTACSEK